MTRTDASWPFGAGEQQGITFWLQGSPQAVTNSPFGGYCARQCEQGTAIRQVVMGDVLSSRGCSEGIHPPLKVEGNRCRQPQVSGGRAQALLQSLGRAGQSGPD